MQKSDFSRLPFQAKQLSNDDLVSGDKSENYHFMRKKYVIMEEDIHSQVFTLDDKMKDNVILSKLCSNEKHFKYAAKNSKQEGK